MLRISSLKAFRALGLRNYSLPVGVKNKVELMQSEYNGLNKEITSNYSHEVAIKIARLQPIVEKFEVYTKAESEVTELVELMNDPQLGAEARSELAATREKLSKLTEQLKAALIPPHPFAERPCILEIRPGVGGSEAALFAADLVKMYQNYCSRKRWKCELVSVTENPNGGITEAILNVKEAGSYAQFQHDAGVHRVQRVPETEVKGRTHTSTAAVVVLPDLGDDPIEDSILDPKDLRIDVMRASGSGGQHVNTTESAVRIVHLPTNTTVKCQDERSQHKNKARAMQLLQARLAERERQDKQRQNREDRLSQVTTTNRSDKIRTYNYPQNRITDHRSGFTSTNLDEVMNGNDTRYEEIVESVDQLIKNELMQAQELSS